SSGAGIPGVRVIAVHTPSGTAYSAVTRADGRATIPGMRVGGPYKVTAAAIGYVPSIKDNVYLQLGVASDLDFAARRQAVTLSELRVTAEKDAVFSSERSGAATSVSKEVFSTLPTISRGIETFTRLSPQANGNSFVGQDNRLNNITVDGSAFNNSFGLGNGGTSPGGRTGVAPISIDAIEQVQVNVAPFDVKQGNFAGAGVNTVTKSGTNGFAGSLYYQGRNQSMVGTKPGSNTFDPGVFSFHQFGASLGGPIIKDKLFFFASYEDDANTAPATNFVANTGGQTVAGNITRVLASDLTTFSSYLKNNFGYETGPYTGWNLEVPSRRFLGKLDYNLNDHNKVSVRYNLLNSSSGQPNSNSNSLGVLGNRRDNANSMSFQNSGYSILENNRSVGAEWTSTFGGNKANDFIFGYFTSDESRSLAAGIFPLIDIQKDGLTYMSAGTEPFSPANQLRYNSYQMQNNFTIYGNRHDVSFGVSAEKYHSDNVFYPGSQSVYVYNSPEDFYADANDFKANPTRTASPVTLRRFQVRYNNIPGQVEPLQPLDVKSYGAYVQDAWRATDRLRFTLGVRADVHSFGATALNNPAVPALNFRDGSGSTVHYNTSALPKSTPEFSPRLGFNWDVNGDKRTQVRGGTGLFSGTPPYVWISNQIGQNGILTGFDQVDNSKTRPFNPNPDAYKPATVTGAPAASYELNFTAENFKFSRLWRTDIAIDKRLPYGLVGTAEFIYDKDINGISYINANLPAAQTNFTGADKRPRYTSNRINSNITGAYVLGNGNKGHSYNMSVALERAFASGFYAKAAYAYGVSKSLIDPGSIASGSWTNNQISANPNAPALSYSGNSPGKRFFAALSKRGEYFGFGATTMSLFLEGRTINNVSYAFSGDLNGDGAGNNDLIYIPKDVSEMNFQQFNSTFAGVTKTFTIADQTAAWETYIKQDPYLSKHRGEYAQRGAFFLPMVWRADLSVVQEAFARGFGKKNSVQFRLDILNVTNMIKKSWGVADRVTTTQPLISQGADVNGAALYRLRAINNELITSTFQKSAGIGDVWRIQLGARYTFN
ncbi:MAG: carboxypeptidase regulatory-like domain-containing protein, partial [Gemmatimonadota bacterium]